jgi:catechol 2,3-dioxygenase-like lactoylglutathione lyase family enzyme
MINAAHVIVYSQNAEADRAFIRDVLGFPNVDAGDGWLIFKLPPAEVAVHPADGDTRHEFYLMCDDIENTLAHREGSRGLPASHERRLGGAGIDKAAGRIRSVPLPATASSGIRPRSLSSGASSQAAPLDRTDALGRCQSFLRSCERDARRFGWTRAGEAGLGGLAEGGH